MTVASSLPVCRTPGARLHIHSGLCLHLLSGVIHAVDRSPAPAAWLSTTVLWPQFCPLQVSYPSWWPSGINWHLPSLLPSTLSASPCLGNAPTKWLLLTTLSSLVLATLPADFPSSRFLPAPLWHPEECLVKFCPSPLGYPQGLPLLSKPHLKSLQGPLGPSDGLSSAPSSLPPRPVPASAYLHWPLHLA
jgi:hypothetical protein